jgi:hypothetical protein
MLLFEVMVGVHEAEHVLATTDNVFELAERYAESFLGCRCRFG